MPYPYVHPSTFVRYSSTLTYTYVHTQTRTSCERDKKDVPSTKVWLHIGNVLSIPERNSFCLVLPTFSSARNSSKTLEAVTYFPYAAYLSKRTEQRGRV